MMTNEEYKRFSDEIDKQEKEIQANPEKAREFLIEAGILTQSGDLAEPYREK